MTPTLLFGVAFALVPAPPVPSAPEARTEELFRGPVFRGQAADSWPDPAPLSAARAGWEPGAAGYPGANRGGEPWGTPLVRPGGIAPARGWAQPGPVPPEAVPPAGPEARVEGLVSGPPWPAADRDPAPRRALFVFGGVCTNMSMGDSARVFRTDYADTGILGLGYQRYHWSWERFHFGGEAGVALRFGHGESVEFWGGPTVRHEGVAIGPVLIRPSFTVGLSVVTGKLAIERERERSHNGDATLLFYLGPELALSPVNYPNWELFYRLHHRSGGGGTLGRVGEGNNANVIGLRYRY